MKLNPMQPLNGPEMPSEMHDIFPTVQFSEVDIPELKDWKIGEDYVITIKACLKRMSEGPAGQILGDFDMTEVGTEGKASGSDPKEKGKTY